jgi:hypothetical protein
MLLEIDQIYDPQGNQKKSLFQVYPLFKRDSSPENLSQAFGLRFFCAA